MAPKVPVVVRVELGKKHHQSGRMHEAEVALSLVVSDALERAEPEIAAGKLTTSTVKCFRTTEFSGTGTVLDNEDLDDAAVAIMRCRPIHDAGPAHPPGSYADVSRVLPRPPMSLLPPSGALQRALLAAFAAAASLSARHFCLQSLGAAIAVLSLSLGQLQPAVSGRHPLGSSPPPSPLNCLLLLLALSQEPGACV